MCHSRDTSPDGSPPGRTAGSGVPDPTLVSVRSAVPLGCAPGRPRLTGGLPLIAAPHAAVRSRAVLVLVVLPYLKVDQSAGGGVGVLRKGPRKGFADRHFPARVIPV
ncbi:hypothetical protein GCM10010359_51190 [Streptomyces morookaense]|nr:hypothetical protein GCM10010359_51190 [Streptomyces morookaense]